MKFNRFFIISFAFMGLMACSSNNDIEEDTPTKVEKKFLPITIEATEVPLIDPSVSNSNMKKAPISFLTDLNSFYLLYQYEVDGGESGTNYDISAPGCGSWLATKKKEDNVPIHGQWVCGEDGQYSDGGQYGWPGIDLDQMVTWYAFANFNFDANYNSIINDNGLCLDFKVDESSTNQSDLLVAKQADYYNHLNGYLYFEFEHVCSAIRFNIKKAKNVASDIDIMIKTAKLSEMYKAGSYSLKSGSWTLDREQKGYFTLYDSSNGGLYITSTTEYQPLYAGTLNQDAENAYLFMIPQTTTQDTKIIIDLTLGGVPYTVHVPFGVQTFEKGKKYEVNINLGKSTMLYEDGTRIITD